MDNSIKPLHYVPQVKQVNRKERNRDRKDDNKGEQEFLEYVSVGDGDEKNKKHNRDGPDQKSSEKGVERKVPTASLRSTSEQAVGKEDSLKANALNESCGTIIDFEV